MPALGCAFNSLGIDYTASNTIRPSKYVQTATTEFPWSYSPRMCSLSSEPFVEIVVNSVIMRKPLRQCGRITIPLCVHTAISSSMSPEKPKRTQFASLFVTGRTVRAPTSPKGLATVCSAKTTICITIGSVLECGAVTHRPHDDGTLCMRMAVSRVRVMAMNVCCVPL